MSTPRKATLATPADPMVIAAHDFDDPQTPAAYVLLADAIRIRDEAVREATRELDRMQP